MKRRRAQGSPRIPHKHDLCEPLLVDAATGKPEPTGSPVMRAALKVWAEASDEDRTAYHRFHCLNSRATEDVDRAEALYARFQIEGGWQ